MARPFASARSLTPNAALVCTVGIVGFVGVCRTFARAVADDTPLGSREEVIEEEEAVKAIVNQFRQRDARGNSGSGLGLEKLLDSI